MLERLGAGGWSSPVGSRGSTAWLAAGEGTLEPALGVKSSLCSNDITRGCHSNISHGEGVIGERSGAGMLGSFWSCANLHGEGGWIWPSSHSCAREVSPFSPCPQQRGRAQNGQSTPAPPILQLLGAPAWAGQGRLSGDAQVRVAVGDGGTDEHPPLLLSRPVPGQGAGVPSTRPAGTGLL